MSQARACFVFAHGAGAGMTHRFMEPAAGGLGERGVATLRYQFPYMEKGGKRPDSPATAQAAVRAAVAQAGAPLDGVDGVAFLGFPLHPAGKPSDDRARHLADIKIPMPFMQGTRDNLAELKLFESVIRRLGPSASLRLVEAADHSFRVPARSGRNDREVLSEILDGFAGWIGAIEAKKRRPESAIARLVATSRYRFPHMVKAPNGPTRRRSTGRAARRTSSGLPTSGRASLRDDRAAPPVLERRT
jgi:predicted alpha/beta-hydrolase family hydrolase